MRYRHRVDAFELDMAFEPAEVAADLERLFSALGVVWSCQAPADGAGVPACRFEFTLALPEAGPTTVTVRPLPPERLHYVSLFPRTLLEARSAAGADLDGLRREILLTFLRVTG